MRSKTRATGCLNFAAIEAQHVDRRRQTGRDKSLNEVHEMHPLNHGDIEQYSHDDGFIVNYWVRYYNSEGGWKTKLIQQMLIVF